MAEVAEARIARLEERMRMVEEKLDTLIVKFDALSESMSEKYATRSEFNTFKEETRKALNIRGVIGFLVGLVAPVFVFLLTEFIKSR